MEAFKTANAEAKEVEKATREFEAKMNAKQKLWLNQVQATMTCAANASGVELQSDKVKMPPSQVGKRIKQRRSNTNRKN